LKLLFDENLAPRLAVTLADLFPGSTHVRDIGLAKAQDREIWIHARDAGFAIVSKDNDFQQMSFLYGAPPKVIWIRRGNCSVGELADILRTNAAQIQEFEEDEESSYLVL
jgi:predicted nuclease of predicted toxin-antitoxin system